MKTNSDRLFIVLGITMTIFVTINAQQMSQQKIANGNIDARVEYVIKQMTLEEKIKMLVGGGPSEFEGIPRLGISNMICSDGPRGPHGPVGYPAGISIGASFNPELVKEEAAAIGKECRAKGIGMLLGPAVNINRDPLGARFFEYLTEDPYLDAQLTAAYVKGVQSQHVSACVKHFVCNNRDWNRNNYMSIVDKRALHEIYFPAFKAGVEEGHTLGIMTAANGVNNEFCSDSHYLLTDVLKDTWGFKGFVITDWLGTRSTKKAAMAGLDISMPYSENSLFGKPLLEAVQAGEVPISVINDKVRRILRVMAWAGNLDKGGIKATGSFDTTSHEEIALKAAEEGLVLLKNNNKVLPLNRKKIKEILVLGPNANKRFCVIGLGGSSWVDSPDEVTVLKGIKDLAGPSVKVKYFSTNELGGFQQIDGKYLRTDDGKNGFTAKYYNGGISDKPVITRFEKNVDFNWEMRSPDIEKINSDNFSAQFTTNIIPPVTGTYVLRVKADDNAWIFVDRQGGAPIAVTVSDKNNGVGEATATVQMVKGEPFFIRIDYHKNTGDASCFLDWQMPKDKNIVEKETKSLDKEVMNADAVVFVGGIDHSLDSEGRDRLNIDFPKSQQDIINHIGKINPNTIVVLINGSPLKLGGWINNVPSVLEAWYGGSRAGTAVASALFGDVDPSGRLPFTWPKRLEDSPSHAIGSENKDFVYYKEGILVGYRYYLTKNVKPEFPFGYGLSYTNFKYTNLKIVKKKDRIIASVELKNTGKRYGAEVVQLYIHAEKSKVKRPLRELKGFQKVFLKPGETKVVSLTLSPVDFAFYDVNKKAWHVEEGKYDIQIGSSCADIKLSQPVKMNEKIIKD
jgi:beta-glucosidase